MTYWVDWAVKPQHKQTARSSLLPYAVVWENPLKILFSKTKDALWLNLYIYHQKLEVYQVAKIMVVHWHLTFLLWGQFCFLMHLYGEKYSEFQTTSPLEPLGQFCTNFIWSLLRLGDWKIAKMVMVHWPRWPPCPYMVKTFKNLLQNRGRLGVNLCLNHRGQGVYQSC